ncbi:MAG: protease inhibitor I42 family protein [Planctomycetes bacterium]|nr:protease inhibitor I42 family protein [Planctomycetota bacterium]
MLVLKSLIFAALGLGAVISLPGCQAEESPHMMEIRRVPRSSSPSGTSNTITDLGEVLDLETSLEKTIAVGQELKVGFESNAGTGYEWQCQLTDDPFIAVDRPPEIKPVDTGIVGGRILTIFQLHGMSVGTAKITFVLVRPWEKSAAPSKSITLTLHVAGFVPSP